MARAMWKASLRLGEIELPVKLYAAVEDRGVHFRLLHAEDHVPVSQRMVDPATGEEVPKEAVQRGLEVEEGVFVVLRPEELAEAEPEPSRTIEVTRFVPHEAIDLAWYRRPYFLGPDGAEDDYFALARALTESGRHGIARWTLRRKRYGGALLTREGRLALVAMKSAEEVVSAAQLARPGGPSIGQAERRLAEQLVSTLDAPFEPEALRDEYRERVRALVEAKAEGRTVTFEEAPAPGARADLAQALRESLREAKERRVA